MFENDYTINGKHAMYLKFLAKKNARDDQSPDNPMSGKTAFSSIAWLCSLIRRLNSLLRSE